MKKGKVNGGGSTNCPKAKIQQNFGISLKCNETQEFIGRIGGPGMLRFYEP